MEDSVKAYELVIVSTPESFLSLTHFPKDGEAEEHRLPFGRNREETWTALRDLLRHRGERILGVVPEKDTWSGEDKLTLLTELIAPQAAKPAAATGHRMPGGALVD